jgi:glycine betaine/proline transport system permease protein
MPDVNVGRYGEDLINYLTTHLGGLFDLVNVLLLHLTRATYLTVSALQPVAMTVVFAVVALVATRRIGMTAVLTAGLLLIHAMGLWSAAMETLAVVVVASSLALLVGVPLGIWSAFNGAVRAAIRPVLDFMQTLPVFVYLIPTVLLFGVGVVAGGVATMVFAVPPAVRLTQLGIRQVDPETVEASTAFGAARWEVLREVQLPLAMPSILAGVNQVIMLALSMVVVAGLVGGGGLGTVVVTAVQGLEVATAINGGLAVVILAVYLDRVTAALGGQGRGTLVWSRVRRIRPGVGPLSAREHGGVT